jgi:predicted TIM-barrel fold metal-dependent hydrolase
VILDFRVRPPYKSFLSCHIFRPRAPIDDPARVGALRMDLDPMPSFEERSWERFLAEMDDAGIDRAVVMGRQSTGDFGFVTNEDVAEIARAHSNRFVAFAGIDPGAPGALAEARRCVEVLGMRGLSMEPAWSDPPLYASDARIDPIYEYAQARGVICSITMSIFVGPDVTYTHPVHIQRVARRFPNLKIVVPHACWPEIEAMLGVAMQCLNVHLVPDFYGFIPNMPMAGEIVKAANYYLRHRLLYASSYPVRPLGQSLRQFQALPLDDDAMTRALWTNGARLLGL